MRRLKSTASEGLLQGLLDCIGIPNGLSGCAPNFDGGYPLLGKLSGPAAGPYTLIAMNPKYRGLCYRCFINTYPDSPIVRNHKTKERAVADYLRHAFPGTPWVLDRPVEAGCSGRRPDLYADLGGCVLIVEVDEHQHDSYECSCESKRLMQLFMDAGSRPLMIAVQPGRVHRPRWQARAVLLGRDPGQGAGPGGTEARGGVGGAPGGAARDRGRHAWPRGGPAASERGG